MRVLDFLKPRTPTILGLLAMVGVGATGVLAARAAKKEEQSWKNYIPAVSVGIGTIACIGGSVILSRRQQATIASAYALLNEGYRRYSNKVREMFGEEAHERILKDISVEDSRTVDSVTYDMLKYDNSIFDNDEGEVLFYENLNGRAKGRYFKATPSRVLLAAIEINRTYFLGGSPTLNQYYGLIGLDGVDGGDIIGWDDDTTFIDFGYIQNELDDGMQYYIIHTPFTPYLLEMGCDN